MSALAAILLMLLLGAFCLTLIVVLKKKKESKGDSPQSAPYTPPVPAPQSAPWPATCTSDTDNTLAEQPSRSVRIANCTSEAFLHVFMQTRNDPWQKLEGDGNVHAAVPWGSKSRPDLIAWDPVGALTLSEAIIPRGGVLTLGLPLDYDSSAFRVIPVKMRDSGRSTPLQNTVDANSAVVKQAPLLFEGGVDVVADTSAVDGINFLLRYNLTTSTGVKSMTVRQNPCADLDSQYTDVDVGCRNPAKVLCPGEATCTCCTNNDANNGICTLQNQECKFNSCSQALFNIPADLQQYVGVYDKGNPDAVVKRFINDPKNLKANSALRGFCDKLQTDSGDFTTYCYDYNDVGSSPWLASPYKISLIYRDLSAGESSDMISE